MSGDCWFRTTLDEEILTTAGIERFTTGEKLVSGPGSTEAAWAVSMKTGTRCDDTVTPSAPSNKATTQSNAAVDFEIVPFIVLCLPLCFLQSRFTLTAQSFRFKV